MITIEHPYIDFEGKERTDLVKTYSDERMKILQNETGIKYAEAVDVYPCRYTYTETDEELPPVPPMPEPEPIPEEEIDWKTAYEQLAAEVNKK